MIIKSMSRKEPSFEQLASYMSSEKSDGNYDLYRNCFSRGHDDLVREFMSNSKLLAKRKNGNYLYHEIVSILLKEGIDQTQAKRDLRDIAERYLEVRCPRNMVYGCLHEDHDHNLHYHLMISANERGGRKRMRLSQKQFDTSKRDLEDYVLKHYPHLEQPQLLNASSDGEKMSVKAGEVKRRMGVMPIRDEIKNTIKQAMIQSNRMDDFVSFLSERGYSFYTRGKNFGVEVLHKDGKSKKYRFSTLGIHDAFTDYKSKLEMQTADNHTSEVESDAVEEKASFDTRIDDTVTHSQNRDQEEALETATQNDQTSDGEESKSEKEILREKLAQARRQKQGNQDEGNEGENNV